MDFKQSEQHERIYQEVSQIADGYEEDYWREIRDQKRFPDEVFQELADAGWIGVMFPEEYGGQDMGALELIIIMEALADNGAWIAANTFVPSAVFGGTSILAHGTDEQIERYLPPIINGDETWSLSITEEQAGLNTSNIATSAERDGDEYVIKGEKQWTSGINQSDWMVLLARTTPKEEVDSGLKGITSFIVNPDNPGLMYEETDIDIYFPRRTFKLEFNDMRIPADRVLGEVDYGMYQMFDTLNAERVATATGAWGAGRHALDKAINYASEREVWSEPIGGHQAIQHPLADAHAELETARLALEKAAWQFDNQVGDVGEASNIGKLQAAKAAWNACEAAMTTFGGISIYSEHGITAAWEFVRHNRIAPVSEQMIRNFIGHHTLDLPRSY